MSEQKPILPQQRTIKLTPDEYINTTIRRITSSANCDASTFKQIRDFFFNLPPSEFEKYANKLHIPLFMTLCNTLSKQPNEQNKENIQIFKTNLLTILCYIGFKFTDTISLDSIRIIAKRIIECPLNDLFYYIRIIQNSFEMQNEQFEQRKSAASEVIFTSFAIRLQLILKKFENLEQDECIMVVNLLTILLSCVKSKDLMASIFEKLRPIFETILNYEIPDTFNFQQKFTILLLKDKCGILLGNVALNAKNPPEKITKMTNMYVSILTQSPNTFSSFTEDVFSSFTYFLNQDKENRKKEAVQLLPRMYRFKYYNNENFRHMNELIQDMVKYLFESRKATKQDTVNFFKFEAGVLHFSQYPHTSAACIFRNNFALLKYTNDDLFLKSKLVSLMYSTIDTCFIEMSLNLRNVQPKKGADINPATFWGKMKTTCDSFSNMVKLFQKFLLDVFPKEYMQKPTLKSSIDTIQLRMNVLDLELIYSCFIHGLMFLVRFTFFYEKGAEIIKNSDFHCDNESNTKNSTINVLLRRSHWIAAKELFVALTVVPSFMAQNIWDMFLADFFKMKDPSFDLHFFGFVITNQSLVESFLHSLVNYSVNAFKNGYDIAPIIKCSTNMFERLSSKPQKGMRTPDFFSRIKLDGKKYIDGCKELLHSHTYSSNAINLMMSFCKFVDFLINMVNFKPQGAQNQASQNQGKPGQAPQQAPAPQTQTQSSNPHQQTQFSSFIFNDNFVKEISVILYSIGASAKLTCVFLNYALNIQPDVIKNKFVQTCLIKASAENLEETLPLIEQAYERSNKTFLTHPLLPQFFGVLYANLDTCTNEATKQLILQFLVDIPQKIADTTLSNEPMQIMKQKTLILKVNEQPVTVSFDNFVHAIDYALNDSPSSTNLWKIREKLTLLILEENDWNIERRKYCHTILLIILQFYEKNEKECNKIFTSIIKNYSTNITIIAHTFCAICSFFKNPPHQFISSISATLETKEEVTNFIKEISLIVDLKILPTKRTIESICRVIMKEVDKEKISPVFFALLVHRAIMKNFSPEWKDSQKCDKLTKFLELDFTPRELQGIIIFARDLLATTEESLMPILNTMRTSSAFFSILVQSEILSKCKYTEEVKEFIAECFKDSEIEFDYGLYRFLGPLFRSFPEALNDFEQQVRDLLISKLSWFCQPTTSTKQQGAYLVLLVPALNSPLFNISDFASAIPVLAKFMDHQTSFLKCQAQLVTKIFAEKGTDEMKAQIKGFVVKKLRDAGITTLDKVQNKLMAINWKLLNTSLFSYFLVVPNEFINAMAVYFMSIRQCISDQQLQSVSPKEVVEKITDMCSFIATGSVVAYLVKVGRFMEFAKYFANLLATVAFLPRIQFVKIIVDFFTFGKEEFPGFIKYALTNDEAMQLLVVIASRDISADLIHSVESLVFDDVKKALAINDKISMTHPLIAFFATHLEASKTDKEISDLLFIILQQLLVSFDYSFLKYSCKGFDVLLDFFCVNYPKIFLQFSFKILEVQNPMLVTQYAQHLSKLLEPPKITTEMIFSLVYSEDMRINTLFFTTFVIPFVQSQPDKLEEVIDFAKSKFTTAVWITFLNYLTEKEIPFDKTKYDPVALYNDEKDCHTKLQALVLWSKNYSDVEFIQLFRSFVSYMYIFSYIPYEIKQMCSYLKIPKGTSQEQKKEILLKLNELQKKQGRAPHMISNILKFLINNQEAFTNPILILFYYTIQEHALYIETSLKKPSFRTHVNLFIELGRTITGKNPDKEIFLANHLAAFAIKIILMFKGTPDNFITFSQEFFTTIIMLIRVEGTQISLASEILSLTIELHKRATQSQQNDVRAYQQFLKLLPEIVAILSRQSNFPLYESVIDLSISIIMTPGQLYLWQYPIKIINRMVLSPIYMQKTLNKLTVPEQDDQLALLFPVFWIHPKDAAFRTNTLLPFALRYCKNSTLDISNSAFYADAVMKSIFENPYESSLYAVIEHAKEAINNIDDYGSLFFLLRFLNQGFLMKRESKAVKAILMSFMSVPKVASKFLKYAPFSTRNMIIPELSYSTKLFSLYRIYPKLGNEAKELIEKIPRKDLIERCKESELWYIPFASFLQEFFEITINDALRIVQYVLPPASIKSVAKATLDLTPIETREMKFIIGVPSIKEDVKVVKWEEAYKYLGEDRDYSIEDVVPYPLLRFRQGYEVTEKQMIGHVPSINFALCKKVLEGSYTLATYAKEYLEEQMNIETVKQTIQDFSSDIFSRVTRQNFRSFLVANEVLRIDQHFKELEKSTFSAVVFNKFVLSPSDPPNLHKTYQKIRELIQVLMNDTDLKLNPNSIHERIAEEANRLNTPQLPNFRTAELIESSPKDVEALLCQLFALNNVVEPTETILEALLMCLKSGNQSNATLAILYHFLPHIKTMVTTISKKIGSIPKNWAPFFAKKIANNQDLVPMLSILPKSTDIILVLKSAEIGIDVKRDVDTFIKPIKNVVKSERAQLLKKVINSESEVYNMLIEKKAPDNETMNRANEAQQALEEKSKDTLALGEYLVASIVAPLAEEYNGNALSLLMYLNSPQARYISIQLLTSTGARINYILTCGTPMKTKFALFTQLVSSLFRISPSSFRRNISLSSIVPLHVADDFYLTRTDADPYVKDFVLDSLIDAVHGKRRESKRITRDAHEYSSKQSMFEFYKLFASRFGALSLLQTCFNHQRISPFEMTIDGNRASMIAKTLEKGDSEKKPVFRLFGKAAEYLDMPLIKGPFRGSFIAAADTIVNYSPKVRLFLRTIMKQEPSECIQVTDNAVEYSTRSDNTDETQKIINTLIKESIEAEEDDELTWI